MAASGSSAINKNDAQNVQLTDGSLNQLGIAGNALVTSDASTIAANASVSTATQVFPSRMVSPGGHEALTDLASTGMLRVLPQDNGGTTISNNRATVYASAVRSSSPSVFNVTNNQWKGIYYTVIVTANADSIQPRFGYKDNATGTLMYVFTATAVAGTGTFIYYWSPEVPGAVAGGTATTAITGGIVMRPPIIISFGVLHATGSNVTYAASIDEVI